MAGQNATAHAYAGFLGGLTASVSLQPLDLLKTRMQQTESTNLLRVLKSLNSVKELWRGTAPSAIRMSVGASLYLSLLGHLRQTAQTRSLKKRLGVGSAVASGGYSSDLPKLSMQTNLALGAFARSVVGFITMPATVIKVRFESSLYSYKSIAEATRHIWKLEGLAGFFRGYVVTCSRDAPYAGLYVLFYEQGKSILNRAYPALEDRTPLSAAVINSGSAINAAILATTVTAPFDTIKTKLQVDSNKYSSFAKTLKLTLSDHGLRGLFRGLGLRLGRKALSSGISWCVYEELMRRARPS